MGKLFLMRWNPAISSYTADEFDNNRHKFPDGFRIDWSVWDYDQAQCGDCFVMMRVGDYKPGIVFYGRFMSHPYTDTDWAGTDKKRHYVLMDCFGFHENGDPVVTAGSLQSLLPEVNWMHGHSGEVLDDDIAKRLTEILQGAVPNFKFHPDSEAKKYAHEWRAARKLDVLMEQFSALNPSIHTSREEDYNWLGSDEGWCRCLLIPNPCPDGQDIEVEADGEFTLYFAGAHGHYDNDADGYDYLVSRIDNLIQNKKCAYSCSYEGWDWCGGMVEIEPTREGAKEFLKDDDEYFIRMLGEYTEREIKPEGVVTLELYYFDKSKDAVFSFKLSELSDKINVYRARQLEVEKLWGDDSEA